MTCTVGHVDGDVVVIGSDSSATDDSGALSTRRGSQKVWVARVQEDFSVLVGFSGGFAQGCWVRHNFKWPQRPVWMAPQQWLVARVQPALKTSLSGRFGSAAWKEMDWALLVGLRSPGRLYVLSPCGDVEEASVPYAAIGAAAQLATGCLAALEAADLPSWVRVEQALYVSERFHSTVRAPMHILAL